MVEDVKREDCQVSTSCECAKPEDCGHDIDPPGWLCMNEPCDGNHAAFIGCGVTDEDHPEVRWTDEDRVARMVRT